MSLRLYNLTYSKLKFSCFQVAGVRQVTYCIDSMPPAPLLGSVIREVFYALNKG